MANKQVVFVLLKLSTGSITGRFGVASVLSIVGGGLTMFLGALTTSDTFFFQVTSAGAIIIFFGGLLQRKPENAPFWGLIIVVASLSAWFSLPNEVKFGIFTKFEDFSPLIFLGPLLTLTGGLLALAWGIPFGKSKRQAEN